MKEETANKIIELDKLIEEVRKRMRCIWEEKEEILILQKSLNKNINELDIYTGCLSTNFNGLKKLLEDKVEPEFIYRTDTSSQYSSEKIEIDFEKNWKNFVESCGRTIEEYPYEMFSPIAKEVVVEKLKKVVEK